MKKVSEARVAEMTDKLCDKLLNGKDQHRDIASIALKTIISEISSVPLAQSVLVSLTPQLIKGIIGPVSFQKPLIYSETRSVASLGFSSNYFM